MAIEQWNPQLLARRTCALSFRLKTGSVQQYGLPEST